jgi:DNA repair protein SbcD/Mre11
MRILHTADWHLGKKLDQHDRTEEHQRFLDWLLQTIDQQKIDALLIAGDIFDTGSPANETLRMYYNFLVNLRQTCCRQAVIIGGNHDSISTLNAPRELLRALQVHVVGGVPENAAEQIIPLTDETGAVQAVVAAVPFLRDRDVRLSVSGETAAEREQRLREGITAHYTSLLPLMESYLEKGISAIATGHLFAQGATPSDSEKEIHVGTLGQLPASAFPAAYHYIALGHLHKPQTVGGLTHIRYSGSPIPLSFSESNDQKQVVILTVEQGKDIAIENYAIPLYRPLIRISGTPEKVKEKIRQLNIERTDQQLPAWVEIQVHTNSLLIQLQDELMELLATKTGFGQLFLRQLRLREATGIHEHQTDYHQLVDMSPQHVFELRLASVGEENAVETLRETYAEALQMMAEKEGAL